ncbi:ABC transporter ATP-binding protein [Gluconacetobacter diazotrophicus]|uniref:Putative ABC transporter n=1 Tax=Gluconacetobacter diazotrophicus (strain ATCC 49037 / DSM 5601 / CCUG 37298 / CIP 103539 / LMG 7603 / PAl5) TaxID=272568 RepID=A9H0S6_GLUDA|nr:ABC transporter ATP-binding protein [Gluconacetobacter diazotrophicus]CAP57167.1 putative ABC transporter [Gluconacetobacter diazotrophicus PA1 5]
MAEIILDHACVEFSIYNARSRSLRNDLMKRVGGHLGGSPKDDRVVVHALRDINLHLQAGTRLALVGHNGAGKSTMLRLLSGVYEPSAGRAVITGKVSSLLDLSMGMDVEQTGRDNIILRAVFLGMTFTQAKALVPEIAEFSELGPYLDLPMRTYSSGMAMRLGFGVSTAIQPDILLMDEMISVGDVRFAAKAKARLQKLMEQARIWSSPRTISETLREYCDRAVWLQEGRIVADGPLEDILARAHAPD